MAMHGVSSFSITPGRGGGIPGFKSYSGSRLYSTVEAPPTETDEVYGTTVGDTKGAALRLENVAISRGASPLLKNIEWNVQPKERWGIGRLLQ